jgi:hypothetical protein
MIDFLIRGGIIFTLPLTFLALAVLVLAGRTIALLAADRSAPAARTLALLLHTGIFSFVFGLLGQGISLYQMVTAIEGAGGVSPAIVAGGLRVSFIVPLFGLSILAVSLLIWIGLRIWHERMYPDISPVIAPDRGSL